MLFLAFLDLKVWRKLVEPETEKKALFSVEENGAKLDKKKLKNKAIFFIK